MLTNASTWEFCLCYRADEFSHWEWRRHDGRGTMTSAAGFPSLSTCVHDAMKNGYTGGGRIMPGIVDSSGTD